MALSEEELVLLAKRTLGLHPNTPVSAIPDCYLKELQRHLNLCSDDTNFTVVLQPGRGLGIVRCLEDGCQTGADIPLTPRIAPKDGGRKDGLGSLSAYRAHISNYPPHKQGCLRRLKAEKAKKLGASTSSSRSAMSAPSSSQAKTPESARKAGILSVLDASLDPPKYNPLTPVKRSTPSRNPFAPTMKSELVEPTVHGNDYTLPLTAARQPTSSRPMLSAPKFEHIEPTVSRKRYASAAFPKLSEPESDDEGVLLPVKKQRISPPMPALFVDLSPVKSAAEVNDIRSQIDDVRASMLHLQPQIDRIKRKKTKTKSETTRLQNLQSQMAALVRKRDTLDTSIPTAARFPRTAYPAAQPGRAEHGQGLPGLPGLRGLSVQPGMNHVAAPRQPYAGAYHRHAYDEPKPWDVLVPGPSQPVASSSNSRYPLPTVKAEQKSLLADGALSSYNAALKRNFDEKLKMPRVDVSPPDSDVENVPPAWPNMMANNGRAHRGDDYFDENGDFFGRGKDTFAGPIAKADDIDKFLVAAGNAEQFDGNASVDRALAKLNLNSIFDPLPGMTVALMPHQAIGVAWMLGMEKSIYRGGCMADEMGLGKTVQMMSVIVSNQSDDPMQKTTLIVAPLALLDQWQMELESKTDCGITCLIYHGQTKPRKKSDLLKYDVILTTFGTLAMEWPDAEAQEKKKKQRNRQSAKKKDSFVVSDSDYSDDAPSRRKSKKKQTRGLLFEVDWWRIVIDEAQNIRNRRTRVSRAVSEMSAKYRWCLTGTPIINGLGDAYGTLRFLKIRPWYDWKEFNGHVARLEKKNPTLATTRLQVIFTSMLIRRKKDSMLDGKRLVELPPKTVELRKLEFTTDEREIYNMVEVKSQAVFNRFLRAGTVLKNYHQVLVMLLRLRQICSHPSLIYEKGGAFANGDDGIDDSLVQPEAKSELDRAAKLVSPEFVARMRFRFKQAALHRIQAEKESDDAAADDEECPIRMDGMVDPMLTPCTHVFCRECIQNVLNGPHVDDANNEIRYKADERPCPTCRGAISETKLFSRLAFEPTDQELEKAMNPESDRVDVDDVMKKTKSAKGKARKRNARRMMYSSDAEEAGADDIEDDEEDEEEEDEDDDDLRDFIVQDDEDEEEKDERRAQKKRLGKARAIVLDSDDEADAEIIYGKKSPEPVRPADGKIRLMSKFIPSTKMKHMMENLLQCAKEGPDEKTLIISQWTQNLDLVSSYLTENGILHVKYQGDMDRAKRDQAVRVFMAKDKAKVMLMSLKCGGVGLNLTRANRVISLDLGWSEAIENQAFDRVHRLGQHRPVFVSRLVIGDTVEDRILALQERKRNLAEGSLGEGAGKKVGRLSVRELANLFGMDTRGRLLHNDA